MKSRPALHVQLEEVCGLQILAERGGFDFRPRIESA